MDWAAGTAGATDTQSEATGGKGAQQLLLDSTSCTTRLVIWSKYCFQLSIQSCAHISLSTHGYTALCFLSNLSGVPAIRQQTPTPLESSSVEQSEFREEPILCGSAVDLLSCLKSVVPLGAFSVTFAIPHCLKAPS